MALPLLPTRRHSWPIILFRRTALDASPSADFQRLAALWGIALSQPVTPEELAAFVAYWQAEGKVFHHVQWQQKLARSVQISRASNGGQPKRDVNSVSEPDSHIPRGFRG